MGLSSVQTNGAPKAIGPYSQAVKAGNFIVTSGQIALDPETGTLAGDDIEAQTRQVMRNLKEVLGAAGSGFGNVVETLIFCTDLSEFETINRIYGEIMGGHKPARSTIGVASLPKGAKIEMRMVAFTEA
ncbi:MAG: RidA family protein [Spirochaetales bacterium]|nr:RidA family protein [Spirochaetales bacterium]